MEMPPIGSGARARCLAENRKLAARSRGLLPPLNEEAARVQVIGGNHTTAFCRAMKAGCSSPIKELCNESGKLDVANLAGQPAFVDAVQHGLRYLVIAYQVEVHVHGFVDFVRSARRPRRPVFVVVVVVTVAVAVVAVALTRRSLAL